MKKYLALLISAAIALSLVPAAIADSSAVTSIVTGTGDSLENGALAAKDGEIGISFNEEMDETSLNKSSVKLQTVDTGTAIDFGENGTYTKTSGEAVEFKLAEPFEKNVYWIDITGAVRSMDNECANSMLIFARSKSESGQADHIRMEINRPSGSSSYRLYFVKNNSYGRFVNISDEEAKNFNIKVKLDLTSGSMADVYLNNSEKWTGLEGSEKENALDGAVSTSIVVYRYTEVTKGTEKTFNRSTIISDILCKKGNAYDTAQTITSYDFKSLESLESVDGITLPSNTPEGTSYVRLAENVEYTNDIAYTGEYNSENNRYTINIPEIEDGKSCRLTLTGLKTKNGETLEDITVPFTADINADNGKTKVSVESADGYSLEEYPSIGIQNSKLSLNFSNEISGFDANSIAVGKYELGDYTNFNYITPANSYPAGSVFQGISHDASRDLALEINIRPQKNEKGNGYFNFNVGSKLIQISYAATGRITVTGGGSAPVTPGEWYKVNVVMNSSGYKYYINGNLQQAINYSWDFSSAVSLSYGLYLLEEGALEYDLKDIKLYYNDDNTVLNSFELDRNNTNIPQPQLFDYKVVQDEIIINDKLDLTSELSEDGKSVTVSLPDLENNTEYAVNVSGFTDINGKSIPSKTVAFTAKEYFEVPGFLSIAGLTDASGRELTNMPYLSSKNADFDIKMTDGTSVDLSTLQNGVKLERFEKEDVLHIKQTKKNSKDSWGVTTQINFGQSKTKPFTIELNMLPLESKGQSNMYFNIGNTENRVRAQLSYYQGNIKLANRGATNIGDKKLHKIQVRVEENSSFFIVDGNQIYENTEVNYNNIDFMSFGFYSIEKEDGIDCLDTYIKNIKVYEDEDSPLYMIDAKNVPQTIIDNPEVSIAKDVELLNEEVPVKLSCSGESIKVEPAEALSYLNTYRVRVSKELKDTNGCTLINPVAAEFMAVYSDKLYAKDLSIATENGLPVSGYSGVITGSYNIYNYTGSTENAAVILAVYNGNEMIDAVKKDVSVSGGGNNEGTITYTAGEALGENAKAVLYVWENMDNIIPIVPQKQK